jgi:hypothetical protein
VTAYSPLLDEVLEAHGGLERWRAARSLKAQVRSGGLLLRTRVSGNKLAAYAGTMTIAEPHFVLDPFPNEGHRGVYELGTARIETVSGELTASRDDPRTAFAGLSGLRRNLRWDPLDATYFAGYAMWNYLTTPLLLTRDGMRVQEGEPWREADEEWRRLEVDFPPDVDTHSAHQTFYVDGSGLIRRHDYTAEVVGGWANAAHYCDRHREFDGLVFPTRRRVLPRGLRNRSLPGPTLVWIEIDEVSVASA